MRIRLIPLFALLVALGMTLAPGASAAVVPPGNSAATQYAETLPGAGGEEAPEKDGDGEKATDQEGKGGESSVPASTAAELEELGPEGEAALNLANEGAPKQAKHQKKKEGGGAANPGSPGGPASGSGGSSSSGGSSAVGEVLGGAAGTSGGGLGFLQPLILAAVLIGAGAYLMRRRRTGPGDRTESPQH
jgi:hypothetical protein